MKDVRALLSGNEVFGGRRIDVETIYKDDPDHKCFLVRVSGSPTKYKVRIQTELFPDTVDKEYLALAYLKPYGFSWLPEIYSSTPLGRDEPKVLVCEYFDGESLNKHNDISVEEYQTITCKIVEIIDNLHSVRAEYFGDIGGERVRTWSQYFTGKFTNHVDNSLRLGLIDDRQYGSLLRLLAANDSYLTSVGSSFLHFDIKPANIIYDRTTRTTALVDFELCRFGDARMEYVRLLSLTERDKRFINHVAVPVVRQMLGAEFDEFKTSGIVTLYQLYNLLGYYSVGLMKYGIRREYLGPPIQELLSSLD